MTIERRVLIAADEPLARDRVQSLIARHSGHRVVSECVDRDEALTAIDRDRPHLATRFLVRATRGDYFVHTEDIETAVGEGNYVALTARGRVHLVRQTMKSFEASVDPKQFARIHRSTIVRIDRVARIEALAYGKYRVTMNSGARFESSRTHTDLLLTLLSTRTQGPPRERL